MSDNNKDVIEKDTNDSKPATEEVKIEEVKVEEPRVEEPKVEEVKVEEPKVEKAAAPAKDVVTAPAPTEKQGLGPVANGAMGVTTVKVEPKPVAKKDEAAKEETVAVHSTRNVTWAGVGKVYIGYNIVSKSASEKWLTRDHVRLATPEEVAKEFSK